MSEIDWSEVHTQLAEADEELHLRVSREAIHWPELMEQRARQLQQRGDRAEQAGLPYLSCSLGSETVLLPLQDLTGIEKFSDCAPLPLAPPALLGICHHGGQMVSVLDLAAMLDLTPAGESQAFILFVRTRPELGLRIDRPGEVMHLGETELSQLQPGISPLIAGVTQAGQLVLSLKRLGQHPLMQAVMPGLSA